MLSVSYCLRESVLCHPTYVRSLSDTKEESGEEETLEILGDRGQGADNGPKAHGGGHVPGGADASEGHVGRDLAEAIRVSVTVLDEKSNKSLLHVTDEENRHACLVLGSRKVEVLLDAVDLRERDGVTVQVI